MYFRLSPHHSSGGKQYQLTTLFVLRTSQRKPRLYIKQQVWTSDWKHGDLTGHEPSQSPLSHCGQAAAPSHKWAAVWSTGLARRAPVSFIHSAGATGNRPTRNTNHPAQIQRWTAHFWQSPQVSPGPIHPLNNLAERGSWQGSVSVGRSLQLERGWVPNPNPTVEQLPPKYLLARETGRQPTAESFDLTQSKEFCLRKITIV